jgi:hypothetical protein
LAFADCIEAQGVKRDKNEYATAAVAGYACEDIELDETVLIEKVEGGA